MNPQQFFQPSSFNLTSQKPPTHFQELSKHPLFPYQKLQGNILHTKNAVIYGVEVCGLNIKFLNEETIHQKIFMLNKFFSSLNCNITILRLTQPINLDSNNHLLSSLTKNDNFHSQYLKDLKTQNLNLQISLSSTSKYYLLFSF